MTLSFGDWLEIDGDAGSLAAWPYADIRRADSPSGLLRLSCVTAPALARLEIRDAALAAELISRCTRLDENFPDRRGTARIVGWSIAAAVSIIGVVWFGVPLAADRLTPLVPQSFERRLGAVADDQVKTLFGAGTVCDNPQGQAAFDKLVNTLREAAGLDTSIQTAVLATSVPNAFALPGGKVYLFDGLLARAKNPDEIAGVLAHELGHVRHRDGTRNLIYNGGTSFLIGLLFGDVTGFERADVCLALAGDGVVFARGRAECRYGFDRGDAQAGTADQADGRTAVSRHRQGRRQRVDHSRQPSAHGRSPETHERRGPAAERPAAVERAGMGRAQGDLPFRLALNASESSPRSRGRQSSPAGR